MIINANLLEGELGQKVFEEYQRTVQNEFPNRVVLESLAYEQGIVRNANTYSLILLNRVLENFGYQLANLRDVEDVGSNISLPSMFRYQTGLVINPSKAKQYLTKDLISQIRVPDGRKLQGPIMISLRDLELKLDGKASFALAFALSPFASTFASIIPAPELDEKYDGYTFWKTDSNGLPVLNMMGRRTLHTKPIGESTGLYKVESQISEADNKAQLFANESRLEYAWNNPAVAVIRK
ncbi:hypothetical protein C4573_03640 [Candidatus Woesearchaeota archaeon]|nr:MAG: hypothetical protein C4573_03640 [Candidatus Woesearchaeota archaeon]